MTDHSLNYCNNRGILVDGESWVPADPTDFSPWRVMGFLLGCNNLVCRKCGTEVRQQGPMSTRKKGKKHAAILHSTPDWSSLDWVRPSSGLRLYSCSCTIHVCSQSAYLWVADPDPFQQPLPPWGCQGHSVPVLPFEVDGREISATTHFDDLVADVLAGWAPHESPVPGGYEQWLSRLYERLRTLPSQDALASAIANALQSAEEADIGTLLIFFARHPRCSSFDAMLDWLESRGSSAPSAYEDHSSSSQPQSVSAVLASRLEERASPPDDVDIRAARILRALATTPDATVDEQSLLHLVAFDPDWAADNAAAIASSHPSIWSEMLYALRSHDDSLVIIAGTAIAAVDPAGFTAWLDRQPATAWSMVLRQALS